MQNGATGKKFGPLADRFAVGLGALFLSAPIGFLVWFSFNSWAASAHDLVPLWPFVVASVALAVLAFINHRVAADVFGWLINAIYKLLS